MIYIEDLSLYVIYDRYNDSDSRHVRTMMYSRVKNVINCKFTTITDIACVYSVQFQIQFQMGYPFAQDQTKARVTCLQKRVLKILVSLTGAYYLSCHILQDYQL